MESEGKNAERIEFKISVGGAYEFNPNSSCFRFFSSSFSKISFEMKWFPVYFVLFLTEIGSKIGQGCNKLTGLNRKLEFLEGGVTGVVRTLLSCVVVLCSM